MNKYKTIVIFALSIFVISNSYGQEDRNFWQKIFGKKSDDINVEQPKNSRDSLASLLNDHLGVDGNDTIQGQTDNTNSETMSDNPQSASRGQLNIIMAQPIVNWLDTVSASRTSGFRIQVYMGDLTEARSIRSELLNTGERATLDYNTSDYYVRIGDFRSFIEAERKLTIIRKTYPSAYVVRGEIKLN